MTPLQRPVAGAAAVALGLTLLPLLTRATAAEPMTLREQGDELAWAGDVPQGVIADPALCTELTCEVVIVQVERPVDRLVVAVDTSQQENGFDFLYDIQLHVFGPDGAPAGSDDSSFEGNVVIVDDAPAGAWRIVVMPQSVVGDLRYRGYVASTHRPIHEGPTRDLLPNLVALPLTNLRLTSPPAAGPPPFIWDARGLANGPSSCLPQEIAEGARRCLRFDQTVANVGDGPLELRARQLADGAMDQRIHRSDGTVREQTVGEVQLHLQHLHFHYRDYAQVRLFEVRADGSWGALVREGRKQGFCLADVRNVWFGRPDQTKPAYVDPGTCDGRDEAPGFSRVGLSRGWADVYPWYLPEQYLEISGVPDGRYVIAFSVNETSALLESNVSDNVSTVVFDLLGDRVTVVTTSAVAT